MKSSATAMRWPDDACASMEALALLAVDPCGLRGAVVRGTPDDVARWTDAFAALLPPAAPIRRIPSNIADDRLVGGLDFAATLALGRPVAERGLLASADGGAVTLVASRTRPPTWAQLASTLDSGAVVVERDGLADRHPTSFAAIALEEDDDARAPDAFVDRVAFVVHVERNDGRRFARSLAELFGDRANTVRIVASARKRIREVSCSSDAIVALCQAANSIGVSSVRAVSSAVAAARASAALDERVTCNADDVSRAARLVLAPRATTAPPSPAKNRDDMAADNESDGRAPGPAFAPADEGSAPARADAANESDADELTDIVVESIRAAIPFGLLGASAAAAARTPSSAGRSGDERPSTSRGRQIGVVRGDPRGAARLDLVATLRAAAPMQRIRRARSGSDTLALRRDDFRLRRCVTPALTTTLLVVDASGSSALHRLAEAKGAIETLLAEGYARRDRVALIVFRGTRAELLLPPTNALARARRAIVGLAGGGGTPLAGALDLSAGVVTAAKRDATQVTTLLFTDGRANVARDGRGSRPAAEADALDAARRLGAVARDIVLVDTAHRPGPFTDQLVRALGARRVTLETRG